MSTKPPVRPNVFQPFLRRFTDERANDLADTKKLYARVNGAWRGTVWSKPTIIDATVSHILESIGKYTPIPTSPRILEPLKKAIADVLRLETHIFMSPSSDWHLSLKDQVDLRRFLRAQEHFLAHESEQTDILIGCICGMFDTIIQRLPPSSDDSALSIPIADYIAQPAQMLETIFGCFMVEECANRGLFVRLMDRCHRNACAVSGIDPDSDSKKPLITPGKANLPTNELFPAYLAGTPLLDLFTKVQASFVIPEDIQFAHTWVVAGSGHGKTTLLTSMIYDNLPKVLEGKASVVLIDSQNVLIPQLERLKSWENSRRLIVIDPSEPVAFSLFDAPPDQLNSALELIHFVFAKLSDTEMTFRQDNLFNYLSEFLITAVPNATIHDFRNMLDTRRARDYDQYKDRASPEIRDYLETDFIKEKFTVEARNQVLTKLRAMLRQPAFAKMFGAAKTKLNLFKELEHGVCVLIKPDKYQLGEDGTRLFGRFWIAQMKLIAQQRQNTTKKTPTFFYIDECQDYLRGGDPKIESILEQARKENIGLTLLHHYADQLKSVELVQLLGANTATKICGSLASADLTRFAGYLDCDPAFISRQEPRKTFACRVRGLTHGAISLQFPYIDLKKEPRMDDAAHARMRQENIRRYGALENMAVMHRENSPLPVPGKTQEAPVGASRADMRKPAEADKPTLPLPDDDPAKAKSGLWKEE